MLSVTYANRLEALVDALALALPGPGRLFDGPWLIIAGRPVEQFVDLELARQRGISGNVDTMSVAGALARLCGEAVPDVVLIDRLHMVGELLAVLGTRPGPGDEALAPIDAYLTSAGTDTDAVDRRRVAVARAVATLFDTWALTRPERLVRWREGGGAPPPRDDASDDPTLLRALHRLWAALFEPGGRFAARGRDEGRRYLTLDGFLDERLDEAWRPPPAVHLFGVTDLPPGLQRPLDRLAARTALSIYAVNPCREFWEDVRSPRRPENNTRPRGKSRGRVSERQLELGIAPAAATASTVADEIGGSERENPFLALWGLPSRDTIRRLDALCDANADHLPPAAPPEPETLLARVQRDIADRAPLRAGPLQLRLPADGSVVVLGAADPRRAWEAVAAEIWALVRQDASLRFSDVAVLVAGPDEPYLSLAPAVFHEANELPHTLVDVPLPSRIPDAILGLLSLPGGDLSRREVLDVITHPNIKARFPDTNGDTWLALAAALGIARGADREAFADTYVERDVFNWDQGLRRLALGRFAAGPRSGADLPLSFPGPRGQDDERYLPAELSPDFRADGGAMALLVRSLLADVRFAREARMPLGDWLRFVHALFDGYVSTLSADDEAARLRVFAALDKLGAAHRPDTALRLTVALPLIEEALGGLRGTRGQIFGNGVAVGSLAALRSLPFRVIFVVGLNPERFPAPDRALPLDPGGSPAGEVTPRQRDRWLFLQALLSARERLYLSYVDRDPLSGDRREPSAVLLELTETLRDGYAEPASWTRGVPVQRDADPRARAAFPIAAAEAEARAVGQQLMAHIPEAARLRDGAVEHALAPATRATLAPLLGTVLPPSGATRGARGPERRRLRLDDLRAFLESPLQGGARLALGLRDVADDTEARELVDEPFSAPHAIERRILADLLFRTWTDAAPPELAVLQAAYDRAALTQRLAPALPAGPFGVATRQRHLDRLALWSSAITDAPAPVRGPAREVVYGRPEPGLSNADVRPALRLTVDLAGVPTTVELQARLRPRVIIGDREGSVTLGSSSKTDDDRDALRPFLEHLLLAATADSPGPPSRHLIVRPRYGSEGATVSELLFAAVAPERARSYLTALLAEIFARTHDYLLPCEAIFRARSEREKDGPSKTLYEHIVQTRDDPYYRKASSTNWGPVPEPFDYPPPAAEEGERLAQARFGLFFDLRQVIAKPPREKK